MNDIIGKCEPPRQKHENNRKAVRALKLGAPYFICWEKKYGM